MTDILRPGQGVHLDDETICAFLDGELGATDQQVALEHQRTCVTCRDRATALGATADLVSCFSPTPDLGSMDSALSAALAVFDEAAFDEAAFDEAAFDEAAIAPGEGAGAGVGAETRARDREEAAWAPAVTFDGELGRGSEPDQVSARVIRLARRPSRARRMAWRGGLSVAAGVAVVGLAFAALGGHPHHPATATPAGASLTGVSSSLGSFSDTVTLSATLQAELPSLAPGVSSQVLPCHSKAAISVAQLESTDAAFSAPLLYGGVPSEVFAYHVDGSKASVHGDVAVVVHDGDCNPVARLSW